MCSTIVLGRGDRRVLAYNYDYARGHGLIGTNPRGVQKASVPPPGQRPVEWTVRHGSVSLCSFSLELPTSGLNERGLCVALMWHDDGAFGSDAAVLRLNPLQWIQYTLDCHATVHEVIDDLERVQPRDDGIALHFVVLDASGACAVVEFFDGEPHVTRDPGFPGLTNSSYARCLAAVRDSELPDDALSSIGRFATLHHMYTAENDHAADRLAAFALLDLVRQGARPTDAYPWRRSEGTRTVWSVLFEPRQRRIVLETEANRDRREIHLDALDLSVSGRHVIADIHAGVGELSDGFEAYGADENRRIVHASAPLLGIPEAMQDEIVRVVDELYSRRR